MKGTIAVRLVQRTRCGCRHPRRGAYVQARISAVLPGYEIDCSRHGRTLVTEATMKLAEDYTVCSWCRGLADECSMCDGWGVIKTDKENEK